MLTLINEFTVTGDVDEFQQVLADFHAYMSTMPGAGPYRLLRSTRRPEIFIELADWESAETHQNAVRSEGFRPLVMRLRPLVEKSVPDLYMTLHEPDPAAA